MGVDDDDDDDEEEEAVDVDVEEKSDSVPDVASDVAMVRRTARHVPRASAAASTLTSTPALLVVWWHRDGPRSAR